jgi:hypothetical protein
MVSGIDAHATPNVLRPYLNKIWVADRHGLCSVDQYVLRPRPDVDADLLAYLLPAVDFSIRPSISRIVSNYRGFVRDSLPLWRFPGFAKALHHSLCASWICSRIG